MIRTPVSLSWSRIHLSPTTVGTTLAPHRLPVLVLSGFLGSGKTTLLNHLLNNDAGLRIGVVVNDFGSINIDAMAVAGQVDSTVALGNGCLCCAVDAEGLDKLLLRLARPSAEIDVIVIEASGLADPRGIVRMLLASTSKRITYGGVVEVVDAAEFESTRDRHPEIDQHLRFADLVVLNKTDRAEQDTRSRILESVESASPGTPVHSTAHGRVDPALLFDTDSLPMRNEDTARQLTLDDIVHDGHDDCDHADHLHSGYESVEFSTDSPVDPGRFMRFLDSRPAGIYRMKGFLHFDMPEHRQKFVFHAVGNFLRFHRTKWARDERRGTRLVLIGNGMDADVVRTDLDRCVRGASEGIGPHDILPILRYTDPR